MNRGFRYTIALVAAAVVTILVSLEYHSIVLLLGIFVVYALGIAIALRYPGLLWGRDLDDRWSAGIFAGGLTFGVLSLANGLGSDVHIGAGVLGFGLAVFGTASGIWMADASGT
jgi:hypothetical protein